MPRRVRPPAPQSDAARAARAFRDRGAAAPAAVPDERLRHPAVERPESRRAISSRKSPRRSTRCRGISSGTRSRARADPQTVRFYDRRTSWSRRIRGSRPAVARSIPHDFPGRAERLRPARCPRPAAPGDQLRRGHRPLRRRRARQPVAVDADAPRLRAARPRTRSYGAARVNDACAIALAAEMLDVHRLKRMLELGQAPPAGARRRA